MTKITTVGIDIAKNIFHLCAIDHHGKVLQTKVLKREKLSAYIATLECEQIVLEACSSSNHWARTFTQLGHKVKLIHPYYVKPFVKTNKNDHADAQAICEAASRASMRFVTPKTISQQDMQCFHRVRSKLVTGRTALTNQIRGLLSEFGLVVPLGSSVLRQQIPCLLEDGDNDLSDDMRWLLSELYGQLITLDDRIERLTKKIGAKAKDSSMCRKLMSIPGVGPMVASSLETHLGYNSSFANGREFAAYLGLVPRQYTTGGKAKLGGISKRGDRYMRTLLIQGAQAALNHMHRRDDRLSKWALALKERRGRAIAVVALANKLARISWAVASKGRAFTASMA